MESLVYCKWTNSTSGVGFVINEGRLRFGKISTVCSCHNNWHGDDEELDEEELEEKCEREIHFYLRPENENFFKINNLRVELGSRYTGGLQQGILDAYYTEITKIVGYQPLTDVLVSVAFKTSVSYTHLTLPT